MTLSRALPWGGRAPAATRAGAGLPACLPGEQLCQKAPGPGGPPAGHQPAVPWQQRWPAASRDGPTRMTDRRGQRTDGNDGPTGTTDRRGRGQQLRSREERGHRLCSALVRSYTECHVHFQIPSTRKSLANWHGFSRGPPQWVKGGSTCLWRESLEKRGFRGPKSSLLNPAGRVSRKQRQALHSGVRKRDNRLKLKQERIRLAMRKIFFPMKKPGSRAACPGRQSTLRPWG